MTDHEEEIVRRAKDKSRDALTTLATVVYYASYPGTSIPFSDIGPDELKHCINIANAVREKIEGIY